MPKSYVSVFGSEGDFAPAAGGGGIAPTVPQVETSAWDGLDSGSAIVGVGISSWSLQVDDVLVLVLTYRNTNNTDSLAGLAVAQFDGTAAFAGGFTVDQNFVFHDGANSTMCAIVSGVCTTPGTVHLQYSGVTFTAGATRRDSALLLVRGANTGAGRVNAINSASGTVSPAVTGNAATGGAGILIAVMATQNGSGVITDPGAPWTSVIKDANASLIYRAVSANVTDQGSWGLSVPSNDAAIIVAYKSATP